MRLQELLNKFTNANFLLSVEGLCEELSFFEYEEEKKKEYWKKYKNRKIKNLILITTNHKPELCIELEEEH